MINFALLASGSKGNCCIIRDEHSQIVIDCGSTKRYLSACFENLQVDYTQSDALLITHSHIDHVASLNMFKDIPVFSCAQVKREDVHKIAPFDILRIKNFTITVLPMSHDCEGTVGFVVENEDSKMVYITDTGYIADSIKAYIKNADYYVFESNHDIEMLMQTNRPVYLKQRIINDLGHLCNEDCANILTQVIGDKTKEIVLAHISQEGNNRDLALASLLKEFAKKNMKSDHIRMYAAEQYGIYEGGKKD